MSSALRNGVSSNYQYPNWKRILMSIIRKIENPVLLVFLNNMCYFYTQKHESRYAHETIEIFVRHICGGTWFNGTRWIVTLTISCHAPFVFYVVQGVTQLLKYLWQWFLIVPLHTFERITKQMPENVTFVAHQQKL